jgi:hypothetical protein
MGIYSEWQISKASNAVETTMKKKGRPKLTSIDNIKRAMSEQNLQEEQWMNREERCLGIGKC